MKHILSAPGSLTALCILTILIYLPGLNGPFLLDDHSNFLTIQLNELSFDTLLNASVGNGTTNPYRPLSRATLILNNYFSGTAFSFYHKLTNLLIHLLTGITLYIFCRLCFTAVSSRSSSPAVQSLQNTNSQYSSALCLLIVAIWLVHPLQLSTVLYVVQRMAQLASFFTLLALIVYLRTRLAEQRNGKLNISLPAAGILAFSALGILCKENAALIPLYLLAIEGLLFRNKTRSAVNTKKIRLLQFIVIFLPILLGLIYFAYQQGKLLNYTSIGFTLPERLLTQAVAIVHYLGQILLPRLAGMGLYLDDFPVYHSFSPIVVFSIFILFTLTVLAILARKKYPLFSFGIIWFLVSHLLESSFLPLEMLFEHRNYLALYGPILSLVILAELACRKFQWKKIYIILASTLILLLAGQTLSRAISWNSLESFAATHLINHPGSYRTHILLADIAFRNGNRELALSELESASRIKPSDTSHHVLRVLAWCREGVTERQMSDAVSAAAIIDDGKSARKILYAVRKIESNIATEKCPGVSSTDLLRLTNAMISNETIRNLPLKYHLHARALLSNGRFDEAREFYLEAWRINPENTHPIFELIQQLNEQGLGSDACIILGEIRQQLDSIPARDIVLFNKKNSGCKK